MSVFFLGGEIIDTATGIERHGITYCTIRTEKISDTNIGLLHTYPSDNKIKHPMSFRNRTDFTVKDEGVEPDSDLYIQYLKSFIDIAAARRLAENAVSEYNAQLTRSGTSIYGSSPE
jgi:hypothetical protein